MAGYQFTPFEVGQVKAHMEHGLGCTAIAKRVFKADGKTPFSERAVLNCMTKLRENPRWRGDREEGSGAPRKRFVSPRVCKRKRHKEMQGSREIPRGSQGFRWSVKQNPVAWQSERQEN